MPRILKRGSFYQWDTGRYVRIVLDEGDNISEAHVSKYRSNDAFVLEPYTAENELRARIPDELLQTPDDIVVYLATYTDTGRHTVTSQRFEVSKRAKPLDYVYTPTESKFFTVLEERVINIEKGMKEFATEKFVERRISESQFSGPQGPQGEIGPQGKDGKDGPQGPQGEAGEDGTRGRGLYYAFTKPESFDYTVDGKLVASSRLHLTGLLYDNNTPEILVGDSVITLKGLILRVMAVDTEYAYLSGAFSMKGPAGKRGVGIYHSSVDVHKVTVTMNGEVIAEGDFPKETILQDNNLSEILVGDYILSNSTLYRIVRVDSAKVLVDEGTSIEGKKGASIYTYSNDLEPIPEEEQEKIDVYYTAYKIRKSTASSSNAGAEILVGDTILHKSNLYTVLKVDDSYVYLRKSYATIKGDKGDKGDKGNRGNDGATFTPTVSDDGTLTWSNNGGLPDPSPVNIKGESGKRGTGIYWSSHRQEVVVDGEVSYYLHKLDEVLSNNNISEIIVGDLILYAGTLHRVYLVTTTYIYTRVDGIKVKGETPVKGTDYWTEEDKTELVSDVLEQIGDIPSNPSAGGGDWNAKEGESGHILNRTHYMHFDVLNEVRLFADENNDGNMPITDRVVLTEGTEYPIYWNGVEYKCTATLFNDLGVPALYLGNAGVLGAEGVEPTGEPFLIVLLPDEAATMFGMYGLVMPIDGSTEATLAIGNMTIKKLDSRYVDMDWNAQKGESGHILNRTHYEIDKQIFPRELIPTETTDEGAVFSLTSPIEVSVGLEYTVYWNGTEYKSVCQSMEGVTLLGNVGAILGTGDTGEPFIIVIFPPEQSAETGSYANVLALDNSEEVLFGISLKDFKKLDNKFLDLDWIPKKVAPEVEIVSKMTVASNNSSLSDYLTIDMLNVDKTYVIYFDGERYEYKPVSYEGAYGEMYYLGNLGFFGNAPDDGAKFVLAVGTGEVDRETIIHLKDNQEHTLAIYGLGEAVPNKLPEEYLPTEYINGLINTALGVIENGTY